MPTLVYVLQQLLSPENFASKVTCKSHDIDHCSPDPSVNNMLRKESIVEFGTVLVYTCSKSCWEDGAVPRTEKIYIQMDTDKVDCLL